MTMLWFIYVLACTATMTLMVLFGLVRVVVWIAMTPLLRPRASLWSEANLAWSRIPRGDPVRIVLACERCGGTANDPEYGFLNELGPCIDCSGYGFDRFDHDFRRMRLLGVD